MGVEEEFAFGFNEEGRLEGKNVRKGGSMGGTEEWKEKESKRLDINCVWEWRKNSLLVSVRKKGWRVGI